MNNMTNLHQVQVAVGVQQILQSLGVFVIDKTLRETISSLDKLKLFVLKKCPVYLCLPYLGSVASFPEDKFKDIVGNPYDAVKLKIAHLTKKPLNRTFKEVTPVHQNHNVIYHFKRL